MLFTGRASCGQRRSLSSRPARRESPPAGGLHCTCTTLAPSTLAHWAARLIANISRPTLTTRGAAASRSLDLVSSGLSIPITLYHLTSSTAHASPNRNGDMDRDQHASPRL